MSFFELGERAVLFCFGKLNYRYFFGGAQIAYINPVCIWRFRHVQCRVQRAAALACTKGLSCKRSPARMAHPKLTGREAQGRGALANGRFAPFGFFPIPTAPRHPAGQ